MVNNAGVFPESRQPNPVHLLTEELWDETMRVNAKSVFLGCKYAISQMLQQEPVHPSGDKGWILNISSIMAKIAGNENRKLMCLLSKQSSNYKPLIVYPYSGVLCLERICEQLDSTGCAGLCEASNPL